MKKDTMETEHQSEIYIPTNLVPPEILQKLKEIAGYGFQVETGPKIPSSPSLLSSAFSSTYISKKDNDECDDLSTPVSHKQSVVHVLDPVTSQNAQRDSNVVSLFNPAPSPSKENQSSRVKLENTPVNKEMEAAYGNRSSQKESISQQSPWNFQQSPKLHHSMSMQSFFPPSSQSSQHHLNKCLSNQSLASHSLAMDVLTQLAMSQNSARLSPFHCQDLEEERRQVNSSSPSRIVKEDTYRQYPNPFIHPSPSPSMSDTASTLTTTTSSSPQSTRSRSPPSQYYSSNDEEVLRVLPSTSGVCSGDVNQKSPKVLTPPETPETEGKKSAAEVFTFDDLACTKERLLQSFDGLQRQLDQLTPNKRSPSTPRHPPSTPTTPSLRRPDLKPSPSLRRISPVDHHYLQRLDAAQAVSPQPKLKTEMPSSPALSTPQRIAMEGYSSPQRRDSLSPQPKKRLTFEEEGISSHMLQTQRQRTPFRIPSPRPSTSSSSEPMAFLGYGVPAEDQHEREASSNYMAEIHRRLVSMSGFPEERNMTLEEEEEESKRGVFLTGTRHVYESVELQNRLAQSGRYTPKRKRSESSYDGNDSMVPCTCAMMERNFLQMAECAYKRIRRRDASTADFDRFRSELAQTNEILRESMGLMKHISDICDHRKRPRW